LKLSCELEKIVLCTSVNPQDDPLEKIALEEGINCLRGSEEDVLQRLLEAAHKFNLDYIVNVTADCPLVSLEYIAEIINEYKNSNADLIRCLDLPHGFFSYGIKISALEKVCEIKASNSTEVWGKYFTDSGLFKVVDLSVPKELIRPDYRLTLDYSEDFKFFEEIFKHFGTIAYKKSINEIVAYLDEHQEIVNINKNCRNAFKINWESQNNFCIKNE
jgi:spore coat polysaccharide biosynthesis protein SpsF